MDPPLIGEGSFSATNPSLSEIWPFNGGGDLGLRMGSGGFTSGFIDHLLNNNGGGGGSGGGCGGGGGGSLEESSVTEQSGSLGVGGGVNGRKRKDHFSKVDSITSSSGIDLKEPPGKRVKTSTSREDNGSSKANNPGDKPAEPLKDYIHVRARRGQATDSHSLAERARREKISERMKMLQDLVPGTNKVIGKALVLDEIINYIQSLQRQVEFLSMKLEAVNSTMIPSISGFHSKDVNQLGMPSFDPSGMMFSAQATRELATASEGQHSEWLHMQLGGHFERTS